MVELELDWDCQMIELELDYDCQMVELELDWDCEMVEWSLHSFVFVCETVTLMWNQC